MKKVLVAATAFALALSTYAEEYPFMAFELTDGSVITVEADNLEMTFVNDNLRAEHSDGRLDIPVAGLKKFYFATDLSAIEEVADPEEVTVEVFSLTGQQIGTYKSEKEAATTLPSGLYVIKSASRTFKALIK